MPRNGDGSGDSGPYEGHEILHGTSGDKTLQHTKHVAPLPKHEDGEALPGMNASGGAAAPLNDASEEYGATAPRSERLGDDDTGFKSSSSYDQGSKSSSSYDTGSKSSSSYNAGSKSSSSYDTNTRSGGATSGSSNTNYQSASNNHSSSTSASIDPSISSSAKQSSSEEHTTASSSYQQSTTAQHHGHSSHGLSSHSHSDSNKNDLESVSRDKAERYVNLNEEDVQHAGDGRRSGNDAERSSQRAPRDVGAKEDVEELHGKARLDRDGGRGGDEYERKGESGRGSGRDDKEYEKSEGRDSGRNGGHGNGNEEDPMRHNAAKYVNLEE